MNMKVLILGSTGMLGHMVLKDLSREKKFLVFGTHISKLNDLFYFNVEEGLEKLDVLYEENKGFDYFINCIGITADKIDSFDSSSIIKAVNINTLFPHQLAEFSRKKNIRVIHISTDGVFSGDAEFYDEDSPCDCIDIYGKTKSLGEVNNNNNFLNIRCSIIGPSPFEKGGLFEWFCSRPEGSKVTGYTNHFWNGVTTLQFAELCQKIIQKNCFDNIRKESSVHHFCPNQVISKYELLKLFKSILEKRIQVVPAVNGSSPVKRILRTKYNSLRNLFGGNKDIQLEIEKFYKRYCNRS